MNRPSLPARPGASRIKRFAFALAALALAGLVGLCALEAGLWLYQGHLMEFYAHGLENPPGNWKNNGKDWTWGIEVQPNSWGFREREIPEARPSGEFRVMVLGDSLTWGVGMEAPLRWTNQMQELLRPCLPQKKVRVLNFARPGTATAHQREVLGEFGPRVRPDLVVVGFCQNDVQPGSARYSVEREEKLGRVHYFLRGLGKIGLGRVSRFLVDRVDTLAIRLGLTPDWITAMGRNYEPGSENWKNFLRALEEIRETAGQWANRPPVLVLLQEGVASNHPLHPTRASWYEQVGQAARNLGFAVVDTRQGLEETLRAKDMFVNPLDTHPSPKANLAFARSAAPVVCEAIKSP